jgi:hypothetical protein
MIEIKGLELLMRHLKEEYKKDTRAGGDLRLRGWSSFDEYPILFALPRIYEVDNVIEVGTCNGASALCLAHNLPKEGKVFTWDITNKYKVYDGTNLAKKIYSTTQPYQTADVLLRIPGRKLFFIDGDHTTEGVTQDIETSLPFFNEGDVMVFHDTIRWKQVQPVVEQYFTGKCKRMYFIRTENGFGIVEK